MPLVQDHKRAFDGDTGPNTGGMGSYTMPDHMLPFVTKTEYKRAFGIMQATVEALARTGHPYKGILYGQFMNTAKGPKVIEFNARFGDPEAMNVLSLLTSDLSEIMVRITQRDTQPLHMSRLKRKQRSANIWYRKVIPMLPMPGIRSMLVIRTGQSPIMQMSKNVTVRLSP